jgi:pyruvate dehydrogenase E2 component (dihydrolipoamide acetyltransferase)
MADGTAKGPAERIEPSRLQGSAARRAAEAKATMPHVVASVAIERAPEPGALLAAVAQALRDVPEVNAAYQDGAIERYGRVNVAVGLPGPVAPTLFDADGKSAAALADELVALQARGPEDFTAAELAGATFTVHGLGVDGLDTLVPVLTPRQAAGLGVADRALTLVADARVLSAAELGRFLSRLREAGGAGTASP